MVQLLDMQIDNAPLPNSLLSILCLEHRRLTSKSERQLFGEISFRIGTKFMAVATARSAAASEHGIPQNQLLQNKNFQKKKYEPCFFRGRERLLP